MMTDKQKSILLDWVGACQSAYHIENTPGHRFGGIPGQLQENRQGVVDWVNELIEDAEAVAAPLIAERDALAAKLAEVVGADVLDAARYRQARVMPILLDAYPGAGVRWNPEQFDAVMDFCLALRKQKVKP